jgi:hypothetical protein
MPTGACRLCSEPRRVLGALAAVLMLGGLLADCGGTGAGSASVAESPGIAPASVAQSAPAIASALDFTVISTLFGLTDLPHRIHWVATPSGSGGDVKEVDFLIDDQLAAVEHNAPYSYGEDAGWLVTSFLEPGAHTFTTKAVAADDRTAVETVIAAVEAAPQPPAKLAGRWSRTVDGDDPGVWHVTINAIGWLFDDPNGGGQNQDAAYPAPGKVMIGGAILEPVLGDYSRGGVFCGDEGDPDGVFSYSVSKDGSRLTLTADAPVCYQGLIEGTWALEQ